MTLLACIPVTGSLTLAEVATASLTAADNTYKLDNNVNLVIEDNGGNDMFTAIESNGGIQHHFHSAFGQQSGINGGVISATFYANPVSFTIDIEEIVTDMSPDFVEGMACYVVANPSVAPVAFLYGLDAEAYTQVGNAQSFPSLSGIFGQAGHQGTGTVTILNGLEYYVSNTGAGTITDAVAMNVGASIDAGTITTLKIVNAQSTQQSGGAIGTLYGIYVEAQDKGATNYGIFTNAGQNEFNDRLTVNQNSTTAAIPTLRLKQADLSEEFIRFDTTVGAGNPIDTAALGAFYGKARVFVQGVGAKWIALYN